MAHEITIGNIVSWVITIGVGVVIVGLVKAYWGEKFKHVMKVEDCPSAHKELIKDIREAFTGEFTSLKEHLDLKIKNEILSSQNKTLENQTTLMNELMVLRKEIKSINSK